MKQYRDKDYAGNRLVGTIVSHEGEPVMIHHQEGDGFYIERLSDRQKYYVGADDLDINPVPLGYCNHPKARASYLMRQPKRRDWRQGLRSSNVSSSNKLFEEIPFEDLAKTIKGIYPALKKCIGKNLTAFHREWAIQKTEVIYKDTIVGKWEDERIILYPKYAHLDKKLSEAQRENHLRNS